MHYVFLMMISLLLNAENSFITQEEYSTQLYYSPRGIGCHHCHGEKGEGKIIAKYKDKNDLNSFNGPPINNIAYEKFYSAMTQRKRGMPRYFLIEDEIRALYFYLHQGEKRDSK